MSFETKVKTGLVCGLTVVALSSGATGSSILNHSDKKIVKNKTEISTFTSTQTKGSSIDMFSNNVNIDTPNNIVKNALTQMKNFTFIEIDDEIDKEIDAFFAKRESKKKKKILYKRI
jgi:hypothetical protein